MWASLMGIVTGETTSGNGALVGLVNVGIRYFQRVRFIL